LRQAGFEFRVLVLQSADLAFAAADGVAGFADSGEPGLEFFAQVCVGAGAVEGGAVDPGFRVMMELGCDRSIPASFRATRF
jgi:hypothetical protein